MVECTLKDSSRLIDARSSCSCRSHVRPCKAARTMSLDCLLELDIIIKLFELLGPVGTAALDSASARHLRSVHEPRPENPARMLDLWPPCKAEAYWSTACKESCNGEESEPGQWARLRAARQA